MPVGVAAPVIFGASESEIIGVIHGTPSTAVWPAISSPLVVVMHGEDAPIEFSGVPGAPPGAYRMRAYDTTLLRYVYWDSVSIDELGAVYDGPGPLNDVVVFMFQGAGT